MRTLYPSIDPFDQGWLRVSDVHTLYYEQSGNPDGTPVVFLHGGPGVGTVPDHRRFFDPEAYRIVLFDQRGAGRSTPHACLDENTTWHLVDDIERLRAELGINRWVVFGGSWGSTLGVAYAERHPDRVRALVLRGVFLGRVGEIRWFVDDGTRWIFPERYEALAAAVPEAEPGGLLAALYRRLTDPDESVCVEAARAWTTWESSTMLLVPAQDEIDRFAEPKLATAIARIECHYLVNDIFLGPDDALLDHVDRIRHIPGTIVQGRYDVIAPMRSAWDLHRAWPEARLEIVADAGHSAMEPGIVDALVRATDQYRGIA